MEISAIFGYEFEDDYDDLQVSVWNEREVTKKDANEEDQQIFNLIMQHFSEMLCMSRPNVSGKAEVERDEDGSWKGSASGKYFGETEDGRGRIDIDGSIDSDGKGSFHINGSKDF